MDRLEMLSQREQLMWDIDGIVDEFASNNNISEDNMEDLIRVLCDAVCKNFPTNWNNSFIQKRSMSSGSVYYVMLYVRTFLQTNNNSFILN